MRRPGLVLIAGLLAASCSAPRHTLFDPRETLTQVSTALAIEGGDYDGRLECGRLSRFGDFGIGTFHALDGEMVVLDGKVYQVGVDGAVRAASDSATTPFACVTFFEPDVTLSFGAANAGTPEGWSLASDVLERLIDEQANVKHGARDLFVAVRVEGVFVQVRVRSVPAQKKPYPPLDEAVKGQQVSELKDVRGTLVGFRFPPAAGGMNVPGYHFHFLTADRSRGGHVLAFTLREGAVSVDVTPNFYCLGGRGVDRPGH